MLHAEGLDVTHHRPWQATREALGVAFRVISLGYDVHHLAPAGTRAEHGDDVLAPNQQLAQARDALYAHGERLVEELTHGARHGEVEPTPNGESRNSCLETYWWSTRVGLVTFLH